MCVYTQIHRHCINIYKIYIGKYMHILYIPIFFLLNYAVLCFLLTLSIFSFPVLRVWKELFSVFQPEQTHEGSLWGAPLQMCVLQQGKAKPRLCSAASLCPLPCLASHWTWGGGGSFQSQFHFLLFFLLIFCFLSRKCLLFKSITR